MTRRITDLMVRFNCSRIDAELVLDLIRVAGQDPAAMRSAEFAMAARGTWAAIQEARAGVQEVLA